MATQAIDLGFAVGFVTDRAGNFAQVRLMGIAILKFGRLRLLCQLIHWTMAFKTLWIFNRRIGRWQILPMTIRTGYKRFGM